MGIRCLVCLFYPLLSHIHQACFSKTRPTTACIYYIVLTHPTHHFPEFYFYDPGTRNDNGNTLPTSGHIISSDIRRSFRSTATPRKSGYESGKKNDPTLCGNLQDRRGLTICALSQPICDSPAVPARRTWMYVTPLLPRPSLILFPTTTSVPQKC